MNLREHIEALLFVSAKPLSFQKIAKLCNSTLDEVGRVLHEIAHEYDSQNRGIRLLFHEEEAQMVSSPTVESTVAAFLKEEIPGELTRPSLETLTVIAYRGPVTRPEIEQIRGVNCALIVRNLLIVGYIHAQGKTKAGYPLYHITMDFLRHLGVQSVRELPDYERLHTFIASEL